jgi:hypothetical protein
MCWQTYTLKFPDCSICRQVDTQGRRFFNQGEENLRPLGTSRLRHPADPCSIFSVLRRGSCFRITKFRRAQEHHVFFGRYADPCPRQIVQPAFAYQYPVQRRGAIITLVNCTLILLLASRAKGFSGVSSLPGLLRKAYFASRLAILSTLEYRWSPGWGRHPPPSESLALGWSPR